MKLRAGLEVEKKTDDGLHDEEMVEDNEHIQWGVDIPMMDRATGCVWRAHRDGIRELTLSLVDRISNIKHIKFPRKGSKISASKNLGLSNFPTPLLIAFSSLRKYST